MFSNPGSVTSVKQCQNPCSGPLTDSAYYWECILISFQPAGWQIIDNVFYRAKKNMVHTQILLHRWGPHNKDFGNVSKKDLTKVKYRLWRRLITVSMHSPRFSLLNCCKCSSNSDSIIVKTSLIIRVWYFMLFLPVQDGV